MAETDRCDGIIGAISLPHGDTRFERPEKQFIINQIRRRPLATLRERATHDGDTPAGKAARRGKRWRSAAPGGERLDQHLGLAGVVVGVPTQRDRKSTRLNSS